MAAEEPDRRDGWVRLAVLLGCLVYAWPGVWRAGLAFEDGSLLFQRSYQQWSLSDWFAPYAGYVAFGPNLLASVLCRLPTQWIPHAFAVSAVLFHAVAACSLLHPGWEPVAPRCARWVAALALAWLPLGNAALSSMLTYTQWAMLLWLFLLLARPLPVRGVRAVAEVALVAALTWSHPLSVSLLPLSLWRLWRRERTLVAAMHVFAVLGYLWFAHPSGGELHLRQLLRQIGPYSLVRVVFETCCGTEAKLWLLEHHLKWLLFGLGCVLTLPIAWLVRCAWRVWPVAARRFAVVAAGFALATVVAALLLRAPCNADQDFGQRYAWIARVCLVLVVVFALERTAGWRPLAIGLAVLVVVVGIANRRFYRVGRPPSEYSQFLQHLAVEQQRLGDRRQIAAHLARGDWPIDIAPK